MSEMRLLEHTRQFVVHPLPRLRSLPTALPLEGAVRIELEEGMPVFRASAFIQARIEELLLKERGARLSGQEKKGTGSMGRDGRLFEPHQPCGAEPDAGPGWRTDGCLDDAESHL